MKEQLRKMIGMFGNYRILVIGDAILDTYIKGTSERICREAPVPVINVHEQEHDCGGAANTAINVAALGAETYFLSVTGKDDSSSLLIEVLKKKKVHTGYIIRDRQRTTLAKKRVTASSSILLRIDEGNTEAISARTEAGLLRTLRKLYRTADAVILSDYGYGVVTDAVIGTLKELREESPKILIVDSRELQRFRKLSPTAVKPNYEETIRLLKLPRLQDSDRVQQVKEFGRKLLEATGAQYVAATMDAEGTILFEKGKKPFRVHAIPQDNKKAIGAGDTFISSLALGLCAGASAQEAVQIASAAAAIVMQKDGTVICTNHELREFFSEDSKRFSSLDELAAKVQELKKEGRRIVFTNGCFDILHRGHVSLLNQAKTFGDVLIVGINSDKSIRRLKGEERPINSLEDRIMVLAALQSVNYLVPFEEDSPARIIKALKPDVFVKGGDYTVDSIPEAPLVQQLEGVVRIIPLIDNRSTTNIIKKIRKSGGKMIPLRPEGDEDYAKASGME